MCSTYWLASNEGIFITYMEVAKIYMDKCTSKAMYSNNKYHLMPIEDKSFAGELVINAIANLPQGGGTPIDSALRAATAVKILTDKIFIIALH